LVEIDDRFGYHTTLGHLDQGRLSRDDRQPWWVTDVGPRSLQGTLGPGLVPLSGKGWTLAARRR
jgi:hypothetical protein